MWAIDELTIDDFDGRRIWERLGSRAARSKNLPLSVSLRCLSTALCVARLSAVLARRLGFLFIWETPEFCPAGPLLLFDSEEAGRARVCMLEGESGVRGRPLLSSEAVEGVEGMAIGKVMAIEIKGELF
jgi:hypothetical protein